MPSETEIVAAAHAVRSWIVAQRATWDPDSAAGAVPIDRADPVEVPSFDLATIAALEELASSNETSGRTPFPPIDLPADILANANDGPAFDVGGLDIGALDAGALDASALDAVSSLDANAGEAEPADTGALPDLAPLLKMAEPTMSVYVESPRRFVSVAWLGRAAAILAVAGTVASGGYVAWSRYASAPRLGTAVIESTPSGVAVIVDGTAAGKTPMRLELAAGAHDVELLLRGVSRRQQITIARGAETAVSIDWNAKPTGGLQVSSEPAGARVLIDGRERGVTPLELHDLAAGEHAVRLESAEGSVSRTVRIGAGRTESITESIYPGWIHVSAPFDVTVMEGSRGVQLDSSSRALLEPGAHTLRLQNRSFAFSESRQIVVEPGGTTEVSIASPTSSLTVAGPAGAEVFVDGERVGQIPLASYPVKLGTRDVMVVEPSGATHHRSLMITAAPATLAIGPQ
jgi:hypothetical protein